MNRYENKIQEFIRNNVEEMFITLKELCGIPAPSHMEHKRAEYCKKWLEKAGAEGVYIDEALYIKLRFRKRKEPVPPTMWVLFQAEFL